MDLLLRNRAIPKRTNCHQSRRAPLRPAAAMLGPHRLVCGSALESETYLALMAGEHAQMVLITLTEESAMAAAAMIGDRRMPKLG